MKTQVRALTTAGAVAVAAALALSACGSDNPTGTTSTQNDAPQASATSSSADASSASAPSDLSGELAGAGASSQESAQEAWRAGFQAANPGVTITYDPVGSGGGRTQFLAGAVAFAGSDSALKPEEVTQSAQVCQSGQAFDLPVYVSPIAVVFNLPGLKELNLAPATIAGIFDQKITTWNDAAIAADNPGVTLPDLAITPVNRSDDSGTTTNFTDYLKKAASDAWPYDVSGTWPVAGGQSGQGSSGMVETVLAGEGTIGYVDASKVGTLGTAKIKVGDSWVAVSAEGAAEVVDASPRDTTRAAHDLVVDIDRTTTAAGAYPLVLVSYLIACDTYADANTADMVKAYLTYIASPEGQQVAAGAAGSAPISADLSAEVSEAVAVIKAS